MSCESEPSELLLPVKILKLVVSDVQNILELGEEEEPESSSEDEQVSHSIVCVCVSVCSHMLHRLNQTVYSWINT